MADGLEIQPNFSCCAGVVGGNCWRSCVCPAPPQHVLCFLHLCGGVLFDTHAMRRDWPETPVPCAGCAALVALWLRIQIAEATDQPLLIFSHSFLPCYAGGRGSVRVPRGTAQACGGPQWQSHVRLLGDCKEEGNICVSGLCLRLGGVCCFISPMSITAMVTRLQHNGGCITTEQHCNASTSHPGKCRLPVALCSVQNAQCTFSCCTECKSHQ